MTTCAILVSSYFVISLVVLQAKTVISETDENSWYTVKKSDLCPKIQEAIYCSGLFNIDEITKVLENIGNVSLPIDGGYIDHAKDSTECSETIRKALCSDTSALCLEDFKGDNPEARKICENIYNECPYLAKEESLQQYVDYCERYLLREYSNMTCEAVGPDFPDGGCTKPT